MGKRKNRQKNKLKKEKEGSDMKFLDEIIEQNKSTSNNFSHDGSLFVGPNGKLYKTSNYARNETKRFSGVNELEFVKYYVNLPMLPTNKEISIAKIGVSNWNSYKRCHHGSISYGSFRQLAPLEFELGTDPSMDYMDYDQVSPVIITDTKNNKYRVNDLFWFPLVDIFDGILIKQSMTGKKIFPKKIYIDDGIKDCKWIVELSNAVGINILNSLKNQA